MLFPDEGHGWRKTKNRITSTVEIVDWFAKYLAGAAPATLLGPVRYRTFGRLGWPVSEIGYGMWGMAGWTGSDDAESGQALDRAVELGCNFFDTAYAYGDGRSERLLRDALVAASRPRASTPRRRSRPRTASGPAGRRRPSPRSSPTTTSSR